MSHRGLILDLDNTLYNWVDAFLPSFRSMVHKLSRELKLPEDEVLGDFRDVYSRHGTVEYPNAVDELAVWNRLSVSDEEKNRIVKLTKKVFSINHRKHLTLFPHVKEVLEWTRDEGVIVVGLSDALERWVCHRLRILGIEKFFQGLYMWHHDPWFHDREPQTSSIKKRVQLTNSELKPSVDVIERVISDFCLNRSATYMVGDSLAKDIVAAQSAGIVDVWARYGTRRNERNLATLKKITPWTHVHKRAEQDARNRINPTFAIDDFLELVHLMGSQRPTLFDMGDPCAGQM